MLLPQATAVGMASRSYVARPGRGGVPEAGGILGGGKRGEA